MNPLCARCGLHPMRHVATNAVLTGGIVVQGREIMKDSAFFVRACVQALAKDSFKDLIFDPDTNQIILQLQECNLILLTCDGLENGQLLRYKIICTRIFDAAKESLNKNKLL